MRKTVPSSPPLSEQPPAPGEDRGLANFSSRGYFCGMVETTKTTKKTPNLPALLAVIFGAVVIVVSMGSLLLTLLAVIGIHS